MAQYWDPTTEGSEGVPLRFPRPAMVGVAIGLASASMVLGSMPALADSVRQHEWWLGKLGVTSAWQVSRGAGVTVAVLGDGVEPGNPDLAGSVITGPDYTRSGRTASGPYYGLQGTAVASLIAGHGHGTSAADGIIGVAPAAKVLSVRVTLSPGDPLLTSTAVTARLPDAIAAGIRYAVRSGARVIDLPLDPGQPGASGTGGVSAVAGGSAAEKAAVADALRKGVVLVAPAGDNGAGTDAVNYPAAYPGVISAGAFDHSLMKAPYSSHQSYVTLTAPGEGVIAATAPGSYAAMSSTSAAGAIVAGIAALIRSRFPILSPAQVTKAMIRSTLFRRLDGLAVGSGYGTANAVRALRKAAVIAKPLAAKAAARAATQQAPTPPPVASTASSLVSKVLKAVVISAGVLILLLLPITIYAAVRRRRARRAAQRSWKRDEPAEASYEGAGASAGATAPPDRPDPMLEFFSPAARPPAAEPAAETGWRAEAVSPEDVPFLPSPGRYAGQRPPAARRGPVDLAGFADPGSPAGAWPTAAVAGASSGSDGGGGGGGGGRPVGPSPAGTFDDFGGTGSFPVAGDPLRAAGDPFSPAGDPFGAAGDPFGAAGDPFGAAGDPFGPAGDPFGPAGDPFGAAGDPFGPAGDPFGPASEPSAPARAPFGPAPDPFQAASNPATEPPSDRPGPAGHAGRRAGSHSRSGGPASRPAPGPVPRSAGRQPRISSTPPWEPAAKPDSEFPWADGPAPHRAYPAPAQPTHPARAAHRQMPRSATPPPAAGPPAEGSPATPPAAAGPAAAGPAWPDAQAPGPASPPQPGYGSIWDAAARAPRRPDARGGRGPAVSDPDVGGHGPGRHSPASAIGGDAGGHSPGSGIGSSAEPGSSNLSGSEPGTSEDPGGGPIYVWNPGASTETFPSVPANRDPSVPADGDADGD